MNPTDGTEARPGRRQWFMIVAFWTVMGLVESTKAWVSQELRGAPTSYVHALVGNMPWWWFWALATPAAFWIARRFPLESRHGLRWLPVHFVAAIVFALVHIFAVGALYHLTHGVGPGPTYASMVRSWIDNFGMLNFLTYWMLVGAHIMLVVQGRYVASQYRTTRLELEAAQLQASVNEARLNALRMELNPHFLFNALNAISGLVRRQETMNAVNALARLGDLLRMTLDGEARNRVPLEKELEFLRHYLDLERLRFHDRLDVRIDVPEAALPVLVPTLILQPLVENAVRHGIARKPGSGRIRIRAERRAGCLEISVEDSGVGLPINGGSGLVEGVGLSNTRARLAQLYGAEASLRIGNNEDGGVTVSLSLPTDDAKQGVTPGTSTLPAERARAEAASR